MEAPSSTVGLLVVPSVIDGSLIVTGAGDVGSETTEGALEGAEEVGSTEGALEGAEDGLFVVFLLRTISFSIVAGLKIGSTKHTTMKRASETSWK